MHDVVRVLGITAAAAALTVAGVSLPASAASSDGRVIASGGLTVRSAPSTRSAAEGVVARGKVIPIECKVRGTVVDGNDIWYALPPTTGEWVSARYVANVGAAPGWCAAGRTPATGRTTTALVARKGPTTADARTGATLAQGATVRLVCKVDSQSVGGNTRWYWTTDGRWVSARYVTNVGAAPGWCTA
ncbi:hypothetical protein [Auraticoccus monumenti]|uniref:Ig-like domain-containing protein n=1 Tax=Auraticoccus monumenti TaxID=675864 RepID=A0A1G6X3X6_9ACTN|nr:hypothetical protein [Auraticoccus monumenti]SDD72832.1 hypothetical protein SAMN04489747_1606 [Auraticoccus monumenti]